MILLEETETHHIFLSHFEGNPVRFTQDKANGQILVNIEDMAKCMGYPSMHQLLMDSPQCVDAYLDTMNDGDVIEIDM